MLASQAELLTELETLKLNNQWLRERLDARIKELEEAAHQEGLLRERYGQELSKLKEQLAVATQIAPMTDVADRYAHRLALELECVLANRQGYYDTAMQVLGEYRGAMNAIHEQHSPTHMGEVCLKPKDQAC